MQLNILEKLTPIPIEDEMKDSYLDYAMSVIVSRALPEVKDGLKPVHRRILYSMYNIGLTHDKPFKKSATIVGDVLGKYHPHGDASVYDALVRMAQDFNLRYPLIDGHGNFGSLDGDPAAAYRYTEARLALISDYLLEDLEKETVDFRLNFDNSLEEPVVLPARLPNLLINGSSGIAVGMATNIPPHNLGEVIDGAIRIIEEPEVSLEALMHIIKAPDFPTGAQIVGLEGVRSAYTTGRGSVVMRAKTHIETRKGHKAAIVVTEIPYQVNKARLIENIALLARDKRISGVSDIRDESDRTGMRIVIELQSNINPQVVLNQLYKHTELQSNFGVIMLALVDGVPRILNLKECLELYLQHRQEVVRRRCTFELKEAQAKAHILEGLQKALDHLDEVIKTIRASQNTPEAKANLMDKFSFSEEQAKAILDMRLQRLTALERENLEKEYAELIKKIAYLQDILASARRVMEVIKEELLTIKAKFADKRRTEIIASEAETLQMSDLLLEEDIIITLSNSGYVKRLPISTYRSQRRGGKGVAGTTLKEEDYMEHIVATTTHQDLLFFTNKAKVYRLKAFEIPEASRTAKGTAIINLIGIDKDEQITALIPIKDFKAPQFLFMATKLGLAKKSHLAHYAQIRKTGLNALVLKDDDELVRVRLTSGEEELIWVTRKGKAIRFNEKEVRAMGRMAAGVKGIKLQPGDEVIAVDVTSRGNEILVVTTKGWGKRTPLAEVHSQHRGGMGVKMIKITPKSGPVGQTRMVFPEDEMVLSTKSGTIIRLKVADISSMGRYAAGVRVMRLEKDDEIVGMTLIRGEKEEEEI
jgi:DNA gyrase subunit A